MTQFVAVKFHPSDHRTYTYQHDGEPVAPGDTVEIPARDGLRSVKVETVTDKAPEFKCRHVARVIDRAEDSEVVE